MAKFALLIGVSKYELEPNLNPLPAAVRDVEAMQKVLLHPEIGGFTETIVLKNPQRQDMEEAIENLFAHREKDDLLVLFFSGHGIRDDTGRLFLATSSTRKTPRGDLIRSSAVAASVVHESMSRSRSKRQVVILDSCFSGAFAKGLLAKDNGTVNIREQLGGEGHAVLTSSSSTQYSFEQEGSDLSIYTQYLIEGITTGAADLDEDGFVSIGELHEYASGKVSEIQPTMKPEIHPGKEGYTIRLAKVPPSDPKQKYGKEVDQRSSNSQTAVNNQKISVPTAARINFRPLMVVGGIILAVSLTVGIYSSLHIPPLTQTPQNTEENSSQTASAFTNSPSTTNSTKVPKTTNASIPGISDLPRLEGKATVVLTVKGSPITIEVDGTDAPITAGNFVDLVQKGVYDGLPFHRVVREPQPFIVQGGDPQGKDPKVPADRLGTGSYIDPKTGNARYIPLEIKPKGSDTPIYNKPFDATAQPVILPHKQGAVAMARSQSPDSASAQFFFALADVAFLDGNYAVFGNVTQGLDIVNKIQQGDRIDSAKVTQGAQNLKI